MPAGMGGRDYLVKLLDLASEIEHGLMIQYLYAAYSLNPAAVSWSRTVDNWQHSILMVAREEMGHLLTVQNVLCLLGGPVSLGRVDFPWDSPLNPFPFRLRPLSRESLSCFVFAEMPSNLDRSHPKGENPNRREFIDEHLPRIEATVAALPTTFHVRHPIGVLYEEMIRVIECPDLISDDEFRAGSFPWQASADEWIHGMRPQPSSPGLTEPPAYSGKAEIIIRRVATRTAAAEALREVVGQGEAAHLRSRLATEQSHFDRFAEVYEKFVERNGEQFCSRFRPIQTSTARARPPRPPSRPRHRVYGRCCSICDIDCC